MRSFGLSFPTFVAGAVACGMLVASCSSSDETAGPSGASGNGGQGGIDGGGGASGGWMPDGSAGAAGTLLIEAGVTDSKLTPDAACAAQSAEATLVKKPVDIIFVIDNSGSMGTENAAVVTNVNQNFAQIIQASGIDYRVILLTSHTTGQEVQVGPPLSSGATSTVPGNNPPIFYHYDRSVGSHNSLCLALDTYATPDVHSFGQGWGTWLRPEALKLFVEITDDGISCASQKSGHTYNDANSVAGGKTSAEAWDKDLLALDPAQFGTETERNYVFYSIIGISANQPANKPWEPTDAVMTSECPTAADPGTGYQWLSNMTGGLKFPVCEGSGFDAVFQKLAEGVIQGAKLACDFEMPAAPPGENLDPNNMLVNYTPSDGSAVVEFKKVANSAACVDNAFYIEGTTIHLCPQACTLVQADDNAKMDVLFGCKQDGPA